MSQFLGDQARARPRIEDEIVRSLFIDVRWNQNHRLAAPRELDLDPIECRINRAHLVSFFRAERFGRDLPAFSDFTIACRSSSRMCLISAPRLAVCASRSRLASMPAPTRNAAASERLPNKPASTNRSI